MTFVFAFAIATGAALAPAATQQTDLNAIQQRLGEFLRLNDIPAALIEAEKFEAAVKLQFGTSHPNYSGALSNLGNVYERLSKFAEAEGYYRRALALSQDPRGAYYPHSAGILMNLGRLHRMQGKFGEAAKHFGMAFSIHSQALDQFPVIVIAGNLSDLAEMFQALRDYPRAEVFFTSALQMREVALGASDQKVAETLNHLADVYRAQGKHKEAEAALMRSLAITQKRPR